MLRPYRSAYINFGYHLEVLDWELHVNSEVLGCLISGEVLSGYCWFWVKVLYILTLCRVQRRQRYSRPEWGIFLFHTLQKSLVLLC